MGGRGHYARIQLGKLLGQRLDREHSPENGRWIQAETALAPTEIEADESGAGPAGRLQADRLMVEAILEEGLGGPRHRELQDELIRYAVPVLRQILRDGRIISKCTKLGRPPGDSVAWLDFTEADREELARDMVADADHVFTNAVFRTRRWSADRATGQASLKTYFVNACVLQFPALYRKRLSQRRTQLAGLQVIEGGGEATRDPSEALDRQDEVARLLSRIPDPKMREFLVLRALGYPAAEAAQRVGLTEKAAENRLRRIRKALKRKPGATPGNGRWDTSTEDGGCSDTRRA